MTNPEARSLRFYCSGRNAIALRTHPDFYHDIFKEEKSSSLFFLFSYIFCFTLGTVNSLGTEVVGFFKYLSALNFVKLACINYIFTCINIVKQFAREK